MSEQAEIWQGEIYENGVLIKTITELPEVEGHLNPAEADLLEKLASEVTTGCIVEIGSFRGKSTIRLAKGARVSGCEVYAIDPHDPYDDNGTLFGVEDRAVFLRNLLDVGVADIVKPIYLPSHHVSARWQEPIGLLWIDGDHSYEGVKADIEDWRGFVPPSGVIAFHDSWFEPVSRAITELLEDTRYKVIAKADATTVIQYDPKIPPVYKRPDVSVLIPAYNASKTIEKAVLSALQQEGIQVQVVVVDDFSADDTYDTVNLLRAKYPNIRLMTHSVNQGIADALNTAALNATGRYFIELDSDDTLSGNCLAPMVKALDSNKDVGFVYGQTRYHGGANFLHTPPPYQPKQLYQQFTPLYAFMYRREAWDNGCRYRTLLEKEGRLIGVQDYDFALQLTEHMRWDGLALRDLLVLEYNYHEGTLTSLLKKYNAECLAAFKARWPFISVRAL
jgi:predicted O-methyltransferase YrrM